jgi:hypothetical protein
LAVVIRSPPPRLALLALIPAAAVALWHSLFALRFAWNYWLHGMSACHAMLGSFPADEAGEWMDGNEALLTVLWMSLSVVFWIAVAIAHTRGRQVQHDGRDEGG